MLSCFTQPLATWHEDAVDEADEVLLGGAAAGDDVLEEHPAKISPRVSTAIAPRFITSTTL
jgi:hypothetical protein